MSGATVAVTFERQECHDSDGDTSYLTQNYSDVTPAQREQYLAADRERLEAYRRGDWHFLGIRARAHIAITRDRYTTHYTLESPGLWGIESDSGEDYLKSVFAEECDILKGDIEALKEFKG